MSTEARRAVTPARSTVDEQPSDAWGAWPPPSPGDRPLAMTSRADGAEHAVMATELEQANLTGAPPLGLCGVAVDPAPLGLAAGRVCRTCREAIDRRRRGTGPVSSPPWAVLARWYEALVGLLHRFPHHPPAASPKALPAPPAFPTAPGAIPTQRARRHPPIPGPRPAPHPAREPGGRHRRD